MRRSDFEKSGNFFALSSLERSESTLSAVDFIEVTRDFLRSNYSGIVNINAEIRSYEFIKISEYNLIKMFKQLICNSELKKLINVNICCDFDTFSIEIGYSDGTKFEHSFERKIIKLARDAGLEAHRFESAILLSKAVFKPTALSVFTRLVARLQLENLFKKIFFREE